MLIHRMTATFGKLEGDTLELKNGLNIIEAPNETGKSTWCAFLLSMLYGVDSRERDRTGFLPDKKHYAPWSGAPMSGRMDCRVQGEELTLTRTTARKDRPMGEFRACYAGTGEDVPDLNGKTCGEQLLGVSKGVYERSAFIRQTGLSITRESGAKNDKGFVDLEKRIAALITSGEEDVSCTEAVKTLREQWNRRKKRKIPEREKELAKIQEKIQKTEDLEGQLNQAREQLKELEGQEAALQRELANIKYFEAADSRRELVEARIAAAQARAEAESMRKELQQLGIPEMEGIVKLRTAIVRLREALKPVEAAELEQAEAERTLKEAESAVDLMPFAGKTPAEAKRIPPELPRKPHFLLWLILSLCVCAGALAAILFFQPPWLLPGAIGAAAAAVAAVLLIRQWRENWNAVCRERRARHNQDWEQYTALYRVMEEARAAAAEKTANAKNRREAFAGTEAAIMQEVLRFSPSAGTLPEADEALRRAAQQRRELEEREKDAVNKEIRRDVLEHQTLEGLDGSGPLTPPTRTRGEVEKAISELPLAEVRSQADKLWGQLDATGDSALLTSAAACVQEEIVRLDQDAMAVQLAIDDLNRANIELHSLFSPALGRRTSAIFHHLTEGRYDKVTLDRDLQLFAEVGEIPREAAFFSAGCADQLYLSVRLAICEMVLPAENAAPIVLDDALANFDDLRCAAALRFLKDAAKERQILLFTCHSREAALASLFAEEGEVTVQRLADAAS